MPPGPATWPLAQPWRPPGSRPLCRHRRRGGGDSVVTNERKSPPGYELEYDLGSINGYPFPGTVPLVAREGAYELADDEAAPADVTCLGYLEEAAFPLLDPLLEGTDRASGEQLLVSGDADQRRHAIEAERVLGWIESFPAQPREATHADFGWGLVSLVRAVDRDARRHRYGLGALPPGEPAAELGALRDFPPKDAVPVWLTADGFLRTDAYAPQAARPDPAASLRWTLAPASWSGFSTAQIRARAVAGRALRLPRHVLRTRRAADPPEGPPIAYLSRTARENSAPLYSALHPVTGDQLLTRDPWGAAEMGYADPVVLGEILLVAPLTGSLTPLPAGVAWASHFGLRRQVA
jgi:hypothetical protein